MKQQPAYPQKGISLSFIDRCVAVDSWGVMLKLYNKQVYFSFIKENNIKMIADYIYSFERQRFKKHWDFIIKKRDNLRYNKFNNAILLPPISSNKLFGDGGVYDENFKIIPESYLISGENNNI